MKKKKTALLKLMGINLFIATKVQYNACIGANDFYPMIERRLKYSSPKELFYFFRSELHNHFKECAQYQNFK